MIAFLCKHRPLSVNAQLKDPYKKALLDAFALYHPDGVQFGTDELYGVVYYFHRKPTSIDADNLSKPVWDALRSAAYADDRIIKLRLSGVFNIDRPGSVTTLDLDRIPDTVYGDFIDMIDAEDHIVYVEIGKATPEMYRMGFE